METQKSKIKEEFEEEDATSAGDRIELTPRPSNLPELVTQTESAARSGRIWNQPANATPPSPPAARRESDRPSKNQG